MVLSCFLEQDVLSCHPSASQLPTYPPFICQPASPISIHPPPQHRQWRHGARTTCPRFTTWGRASPDPPRCGSASTPREYSLATRHVPLALTPYSPLSDHCCHPYRLHHAPPKPRGSTDHVLGILFTRLILLCLEASSLPTQNWKLVRLIRQCRRTCQVAGLYRRRRNKTRHVVFVWNIRSTVWRMGCLAR